MPVQFSEWRGRHPGELRERVAFVFHSGKRNVCSAMRAMQQIESLPGRAPCLPRSFGSEGEV